jgi:polar amino acid transport system substrate-binding protein
LTFALFQRKLKFYTRGKTNMMHRYRLYLNIVIMSLSLLLACPAMGCDLKVRVTTFEPLVIKHEQGRWSGIDVDHAKALLDLAGCRYTFIEMPFARGLQKLKAGELDLMLEISKTEERQKALHFIGPQRQEVIHLVLKKGLQPPITQWQQLESLGLVLMRQRGTFVGERFEQVLRQNPLMKKRMILLADTGVRLDMLKKGRADGFFVERAYLQYRLRTNPDYAMVELHPLVIHSAPVYFAFSKASVNKILLNKLLVAYQQLVKTSKLKQIEAQYQ